MTKERTIAQHELFPKPYVSIDIETTGLDIATCQVIEVGAVIENWFSPLEDLPRWHCYVDQGTFTGQPYALGMHQDIFFKIAKKDEEKHRFLWPSQVGSELASWLAEYGFNPKKVLAAGKNFAGFDRPFLEKLKRFSDNVTFRHRVVDPAMLHWNPWTDETPPDSKVCMERSHMTGEVAHTAVEDALAVIKMIRVGSTGDWSCIRQLVK